MLICSGRNRRYEIKIYHSLEKRVRSKAMIKRYLMENMGNKLRKSRKNESKSHEPSPFHTVLSKKKKTKKQTKKKEIIKKKTMVETNLMNKK